MEDGPCDDTDTVIVVVCCCPRHLMRGRRDRIVRASRGTWRQRKKKSWSGVETRIVSLSLSHSLPLTLSHTHSLAVSASLSLSIYLCLLERQSNVFALGETQYWMRIRTMSVNRFSPAKYIEVSTLHCANLPLTPPLSPK